MEPEKSSMYRLPWSGNDNPIGWVEVTDICNIHCEGCYRLIMGDGHSNLKRIKEDILFLKKWRNCDGISLAGGEPILHPDIVEIIRFITMNGMKSLILTNGYSLKEKLIKDLKKAGLTGFSFHIDTTQIRPEFGKKKPSSEAAMNDLRTRCAKMVKSAGGLYAHFGITVTRENLSQVPDLLDWAIENMEVVSGLSLITARGIPAAEGIEFHDSKGRHIPIEPGTLGYAISQDDMKVPGVSSREVYKVIRRHIPEYEATAYLGGTNDHTSLKWLIGNFIVNKKGKVFGAYGKKTVELAQSFNHVVYGKYLVYPKVKLDKKIFLMSLFDRTVRRATGRYLKYCINNPFRFFIPVKAIGIGIIQAPDLLPDGKQDMCDDCPDMCVHNGTLVQSCRLDECRKFGGLLHASVKTPEAKNMILRYRGELENNLINLKSGQ